jgi:hypothetical protein
MRDPRASNSEAPAQRSRLMGALAVMLLAMAACQSTPPSASFGSSAPLAQPSWPAPTDAIALAAEAGLVPESEEYLTTHHHAHLDILVDGQAVVIPAGIGIDITMPGVRDELTPDGTTHSYFVSLCDAPCLSPLHTHDPSGVIHEESQQANHAPYTLGQFFTEYGQRLDNSCVGDYCRPDVLIHLYLNGQSFEGDPATIPLENHLEIAIVIGQPPSLIPATWEFIDP